MLNNCSMLQMSIWTETNVSFSILVFLVQEVNSHWVSIRIIIK